MKCWPTSLTYPGTKFEVVLSNSLGGDTFTRTVTDRRLTDLRKSGYNNDIKSVKIHDKP